MGRFSGKVGLVTGGSEGIGFAVAARLVEEGAEVFICGRRQEVLEQAIQKIGAGAHAHALDVTDSEGFQQWIGEIHAQAGRLDLLVNNAMHVGWSAIDETSLDDFRQDFRVNVDAAFAGTQAAMPIMRAQGGGAILNVASINGLLAIDNMAAYSASKAALIHFSRCAAMEGAAENVRVNVIAPGVIATPGTTQALGGIPGYTEAVAGGVPMQRLGRPEEVAAVAAFLLSEDASYVTGVCLSVDGGKAQQLVVPPPPGAA
jgi:meso-butanediol dehydrogenase/(S,S)-butanediol dehydrogenase/diacetyl reductase